MGMGRKWEGRCYLVQHSELPALRLRRLVLARLHGAAREYSKYRAWVLSEPSEGNLSTRGVGAQSLSTGNHPAAHICSRTGNHPAYHICAGTGTHHGYHICAGTGTHHGYHICAGTDTWYSRKDATTRLSSSTATTKLNETKTKRCSGTEATQARGTELKQTLNPKRKRVKKRRRLTGKLVPIIYA